MITPDQLLRHLSTIEFEAQLVASTPRILRQLLLRRSEIHDLRRAYDSGCLPEEQIRGFVDELLREGTGSGRFPYEVALAAIAVVLEQNFSLFAGEYLNDLSRVRSGGFSIAARVARECLRERANRTGTEVGRDLPPPAMHDVSQWKTVPDYGKWRLLPDSGSGFWAVSNANGPPHLLVA